MYFFSSPVNAIDGVLDRDAASLKSSCPSHISTVRIDFIDIDTDTSVNDEFFVRNNQPMPDIGTTPWQRANCDTQGDYVGTGSIYFAAHCFAAREGNVAIHLYTRPDNHYYEYHSFIGGGNRFKVTEVADNKEDLNFRMELYNGSDNGVDLSPVTIYVKRKANKATFASTSTAKISGANGDSSASSPRDSSATAEYTAKSGETSVQITFNHIMLREDTLTGLSVGTDWRVSPTATGTTPITPPAGQTANRVELSGSSMQKTVSTTGPVTMQLPSPFTTAIEVCQEIQYTDKTIAMPGNIGDGRGKKSKACIKISPPGGTSGGTPTAPQATCDKSIDYGNTRGKSAIQNSTNNQKAETTDTNKSVAIYAKPGDSIQFSHSLCFGAQNPRSGNDTSRTGTPAVVNNFTITAKTSTNNGTTFSLTPNYLFGNTLTSNPFTKSVSAGASSIAGADSSSNYIVTYTSPSATSDATYQCNPLSANFLQEFAPDHYQIPDFSDIPSSPSTCRNIPSASDAGRTIQQQLTYNAAETWIKTYSDNTGTENCGCDDDSFTPDNKVTPDSYSDALSYESGTTYTTGNHVIGCTESGCCNECCADTSYTAYDYWEYVLKDNSGGSNTTTTATVKIPYNYTSTTYIKINSDDYSISYGGADVNVSAAIDINKRSNTAIYDHDYSTITKQSGWRIISFVVDEDGADITTKANSMSTTPDSCTFYKGGYDHIESCGVVAEESEILNPNGDLNGDTKDFKYDLVVPDLTVGHKFCVAISFWPSDSHDNKNTTPDGDGVAMSETGSLYNHSAPSCVEIAKKPTVQILGAGIYTQGAIITSQTQKAISLESVGSAGISTNVNLDGENDPDTNGTRRVFGSWVEYEAIALDKNIVGFGSGAAFGYGDSAGLGHDPPGGYQSVNYNATLGLCLYTKESIANNNCSAESPYIGKSNISPNTLVINRLLTRYTYSSDSPDCPISGTCIEATVEPTVENPNPKNYISIIGPSDSTNLIIQKGNTYLVNLKGGDAIIDRDITYEDVTYDNINELPQVIIMTTGNIYIDDKVTNVDAWLIANEGNGTITTCYNHPAIPESSATCSSPLTINGPVFASKLILNRTAGAGTGKNSIDPAEIFNLPAYTYLWAYNQAQRFSQAVTTYTRELAPRY
jgi:hypothetical protein